jgi:hypothetical protein
MGTAITLSGSVRGNQADSGGGAALDLYCRRGDVKSTNLTVISAVVYGNSAGCVGVTVNGCRDFPPYVHSCYLRMWAIVLACSERWWWAASVHLRRECRCGHGPDHVTLLR